MRLTNKWTGYFGGSIRLDLWSDGRSLSHIDGIVPCTLAFGVSRVRADGIAGLGTEEDYRNQGFARRVMQGALAQMARGDAAVSFLHGIPGFYGKFGYVTVGPAHVASVGVAANASLVCPAGYRTRDCKHADLPMIQRLYAAHRCWTMGSVARPANGFVWSQLSASLNTGPADQTCRVVQTADGTLVAYAWRAQEFWAGRQFERGGDENAFSLGEVIAVDYRAAEAVLCACRLWAEEEAVRRGKPMHQLRLPLPPVGPVAAALRDQSSLVAQRYTPNSGFMARVIDVGRLLQALALELNRRLQRSGISFSGTLHVRTEVGNAQIRLNSAENIAGTNAAGTGAKEMQTVVTLTHADLIRLVFGQPLPEAVTEQDAITSDTPARLLLGAIFPTCCPHIYLPDRC